MQLLAGTTSAMLLSVLIGFFSLKLMCGLRKTNLLILFFAFPVGCGITSVTYFLCRAFLPFSLITIFVCDLLVLLLLIIANFLLKPSQTIEKIQLPNFSPLIIGTTLVFIVLLFLNATYFFREIQINPYGTFDAYWNWNQKAAFMNYSDLDLRAAVRSVGVPRHPLMLSGTVARAWIYAGQPHPFVPIVLSLSFCFSLLGVVMSAVAFARGVGAALLAGCAVLLVGVFQYGTMLIADVLLGGFVAMIIAAALLKKQFSMSLLGLAASLAVWTKNEGLVIFIAAALSIIFLKIVTGQHAQFNLKSFLIASAPLLIFVLWFKSYIGPHPSDASAGIVSSESTPRLFEAERHLRILKYYGKILVPDEVAKKPLRVIYQPLFIIAFLFLVAGVSLNSKFRLSVALSWLIIGLTIAGYYCSFVLLPDAKVMSYLDITFDLDQQLRTTYNRLFFHLLPSIILLLFIMLQVPEAKTEENNLAQNSVSAA